MHGTYYVARCNALTNDPRVRPPCRLALLYGPRLRLSWFLFLRLGVWFAPRQGWCNTKLLRQLRGQVTSKCRKVHIMKKKTEVLVFYAGVFACMCVCVCYSGVPVPFSDGCS